MKSWCACSTLLNEIGSERVLRVFSAVAARVFFQQCGVTGPSGMLADGTRLGPIDFGKKQKTDAHRERFERFGSSGRLAGGRHKLARQEWETAQPAQTEDASEDEVLPTPPGGPNQETMSTILEKLRADTRPRLLLEPVSSTSRISFALCREFGRRSSAFFL